MLTAEVLVGTVQCSGSTSANENSCGIFPAGSKPKVQHIAVMSPMREAMENRPEQVDCLNLLHKGKFVAGAGFQVLRGSEAPPAHGQALSIGRSTEVPRSRWLSCRKGPGLRASSPAGRRRKSEALRTQRASRPSPYKTREGRLYLLADSSKTLFPWTAAAT